jgi:glycosyltransferase involved in cell wall biosynthesis
VSTTVSVVICAYTRDRWDLLLRAVGSALDQEPSPIEVIVCVDHNPGLAADCQEQFRDLDRVRVIQNRYPGRLGSARNTAVETARGDLLAFLDDDASAEPDWLAQVLDVFSAEPEAMVVGGAPHPRYAGRRPGWWPPEFDWVFGCVYDGLPVTRSPVGHVIGACMSARRAAVLEVRGFHSDNHDDMDLCHRVAHRYGAGAVLFEPSIRVSHYVSEERLTWSYFWRRCYFVNRGKVLAFSDMQAAGNIRAEVQFALRSLFRVIPRYLMTGGPTGVARAGATFAGLALAALGHLHGRVDLWRGRDAPSLTTGIEAPTRVAEVEHERSTG